MKKYILTIATLAYSLSNIAQSDICVMDTTTHFGEYLEEDNRARQYKFKIEDLNDGYIILRYFQYTFDTGPEQAKKIVGIIESRNNKTITNPTKLGKIIASTLEAPSRKMLKSRTGNYDTTFELDLPLEFWYDGTHLGIKWPKIVGDNLTSESHTIYVPEKCIGYLVTLLNNLKE